jgi:pimeloyl-ACP methyl ester carboxylesterase
MPQTTQPNLAFQTHGDAANPAVMLLHGFMSCNGQWLMNIDALAEKHFLVTVELWGHGDSPTPNQPDLYTVTAYVEQFERIRRTHNIARWSVIGQSYGAGLVINYALLKPERVDKVVATNSRSAFGHLAARRPNRRHASAAGSNPEDADLRKLPYHPIHARRFPEHVKQALVEQADAMSAEAIKLGGALGARLNCIDTLGDLAQPLLLTNGVYEKSFQPELAHLCARYPDLNVVDLAGGHSVNIEAANGFNEAVADFLDNA